MGYTSPNCARCGDQSDIILHGLCPVCIECDLRELERLTAKDTPAPAGRPPLPEPVVMTATCHIEFDWEGANSWIAAAGDPDVIGRGNNPVVALKRCQVAALRRLALAIEAGETTNAIVMSKP